MKKEEEVVRLDITYGLGMCKEVYPDYELNEQAVAFDENLPVSDFEMLVLNFVMNVVGFMRGLSKVYYLLAGAMVLTWMVVK